MTMGDPAGTNPTANASVAIEDLVERFDRNVDGKRLRFQLRRLKRNSRRRCRCRLYIRVIRVIRGKKRLRGLYYLSLTHRQLR